MTMMVDYRKLFKEFKNIMKKFNILQLFSFNWNKNNHKKLMEESEEISILKKKKSKFQKLQEQVDEETRENRRRNKLS